MPYQVTRRRVVTNDVLMTEVASPTIPDTGWQYHSDGTSQFVYVFATWKSEVDSNFPPVITAGGTVKSAYWYLPIGGPGGVSPHLVHCYAMFLGDDTTDAFFNQDNPIDSVNGSQWTGGRSVSTANGAVSITPDTALSGESFDRWIRLWGNVQITGSTLNAPDQADGAAVAVYAPATVVVPEFDYVEVVGFVEQVVRKGDLVADYLDEHRRIIEALTKGDPRLEVQVAEAIGELGALKPEAIQKQLLEVRADMHRLAAVEEILGTLGRRG